jgi:Mg-chelatase subunit ChlD
MEASRSISTVIGGLRIAAHSLANKLGVNLIIGGSQACTDGTTIRIPDLPADSEEAALLMRGYLDHEAAHCKLTDFNIQVSSPWVNLIEDIRIEAEQARVFPGCGVNMRKLTEHLKNQGHFRGSARQPLSCLMAWASCQGRSKVLKQPLQDIALEMEELSRTLFGPLFCDAFAEIIDQIDHCQSTADCDVLARRIEDLIANPPIPPPPPETTSGGSATKERQEEDATPGQPSTASSPVQDFGSDPDPEASNCAEVGNPPSDPDSACDPGASGSGGDRAAPKAPTKGQVQALRRAAAADADKAASNFDVGSILRQAIDGQHQEAQQQGKLEVIPETYYHKGEDRGDQLRYEKALGMDLARRQTAQMRARLAGQLQAKRLRHSTPRIAGQRLCRNAVHRIACSTPDNRLFASRTESAEPNTAVVILGDRSGSMSGERMDIALQSAYVTAEALDLLQGVATAVGFFPWGEQVAQVKGFGEKVRASRFVLSAGGSTPMAEALLWSAMQLTSRKEPRKIVIVMTDGQPDCETAARKATERLRQCGIEVFGIGIQERSILSWMNTGAGTVQKCSDLPQALVGVLQDALLRRR